MGSNHKKAIAAFLPESSFGAFYFGAMRPVLRPIFSLDREALQAYVWGTQI